MSADGRQDETPAIETRGLTKVYGRTVLALDSLNLTVHQGEILGFLGPNGAGKTTTIRLLLDLIRPTAGHARIFGLDCAHQSLEVRHRTGFLPSDPKFYDRFTGHQMLRLFAELRPGTVDWSYVERLCDDLEVPLDRRMRQLSRGNRQKVGLVLAMMHRPDLLILDEPTTGLDPLVQRQVLNLLREARAEGRTVFFSSHILPEVEHICDRVAIIRNGRLVATEDVAALRSRRVQRLRITFANDVSPDSFSCLPGVSVLNHTDRTVELEATGELDALVKAAAQHHVVGLETVQTTLEDMFLAYYGHEALQLAQESSDG